MLSRGEVDSVTPTDVNCWKAYDTPWCCLLLEQDYCHCLPKRILQASFYPQVYDNTGFGDRVLGSVFCPVMLLFTS